MIELNQNIKIIGYNARSLRAQDGANRRILLEMINKEKYDIYLINETHLSCPLPRYYRRNYTIFHKDDEQRKGGAMIIAAQQLRPTSPFPELNNKNTQIIKINTENKEIIVISAYINPDGREKINQIKELHKSLQFL